MSRQFVGCMLAAIAMLLTLTACAGDRVSRQSQKYWDYCRAAERPECPRQRW